MTDTGVTDKVPTGTGRVRLRIRFSKLGKIRWTSHRDLARMWERAFRRVQLPLAYSEGFSPRPKVSFGLALSTGHESVAEFLDVELTGLDGPAFDGTPPGADVLAGLPARLSAALPVGVEATAVAVLAPGTPSLQEDVTSCSWRWLAAPTEGSDPVTAEEMAARVIRVLAAPTLEVARNRKGVEVVEDIRPGILSLEVKEESVEGVVLEAELAATPRAVRPAEALAALGPGLEERHVRRTSQWILRHGARREPLEAVGDDATVAPHAMERAS
ncbi:MAG TPA: TIGR03936 family radical SAM-associated protein [Acidimicrobiales bacterium]|nr:TIGR03936 family radical SAM-associated protein [Acidimicrobiales bacterium]